jgi:hypothetical protein
VIDTLEFLTRLSGNAAKVLSSESQFLEGVNDVLATSLFIGSKVYLAQYYSFQLQGSDYPISDSFSQYENVSVIWQPYKSDVTAAYYGAIFATLTGFGGFAQWESQWTAPSGVSKIMNNYPVLNNLCWYELAFGGCLSFTDSTQFPCNGLNLVTASFNCGTGPVPAGPCPSGNNSQSPLNPGGNIISPVAPAQRKRPTNTGMGPGSTVATAQPSVSPVISSVNFIGTKQTQTITISGSGFGTQTGFNGTSQYLRIQNVSANWDAGYNDDSITVKVSQWTDTQITIKGFAGDYGLSEEWKLNSGDKLTISVWNAKSGTGPATANVTVSPAN